MFNEQIVNADGSVTVRAALQYFLGPLVSGELIIGEVTCGVRDASTPADFNGDGKTDFGIYRPSTGAWYVAFSGGESTTATASWGASGDIPVPLPNAIYRAFF